MKIRVTILSLAIGALITLGLACSSRPETAETVSNIPSPGAATGETSLSTGVSTPGGEGAVLAAERTAEAITSFGHSKDTPSMSTSVTAPAGMDAGASGSVIQSANGQPLGVMVSGRGEVSAAPDIAILNLGVESFAGTVAVARSEADTAMARVMKALEAREVPDEDIQTRHFRIHPRYTSREVTRCPEAQTTSTGPAYAATPAPEPAMGIGMGMMVQEGCFTDREHVITGYEVGNDLTVKLRDLDTVGEIIDEVTDAGGDQIRFNGINFSIDDSSTLEDEALTSAINDAIAKAGAVAETAGVELGGLLHISEGVSRDGVYPAQAYAGFAMRESADSAVLVSGGSIQVTASVQALFAIEAK